MCFGFPGPRVGRTCPAGRTRANEPPGGSIGEVNHYTLTDTATETQPQRARDVEEILCTVSRARKASEKQSNIEDNGKGANPTPVGFGGLRGEA